MRCPKCKHKVLQKSGSRTRVRITGAVTIDEQGICKSKCYWCKSDITVPLKIVEGTAVESEHFVLSKVRSGQ